MAIEALLEGVFTSSAPSTATPLFGAKSFSLSGFGVATISVERSFDNGTTWHVVESYSAATEGVIDEPNYGVLYRFNPSVYTSGSIVYRIQR